MSTKRIKDLTPTEYNGSYKVAVDDNNGTKSLEISKIKVYDVVTKTSNGLMSSSDKTKLDGINIVVCTQAEYDASAKTAGTFYFIKES